MPRGAQVLAASSKEARRHARRGQPPPSQWVVTEKTLKNDWRAVTWFFNLLDGFMWELPSKLGLLDQMLCEVIDIAWSEGESRGTIGHLLSGLPHLCEGVRGHMKGAWRLWTAWGRRELPAKAPPMARSDLGTGLRVFGMGRVRYGGGLCALCWGFGDPAIDLGYALGYPRGTPGGTLGVTRGYPRGTRGLRL